MRRINAQLSARLASIIGDQDPAKADAVMVPNFRTLMEHVAQLAYVNKDNLLFFRGQSSDYKNRAGASSFYPTIYRGERLTRSELNIRFELLSGCGARLVEAFQRQRIEGANEVKRRRIVQWSIIQHYEVCATPLLDFTQSVRVACSFATLSPIIEPHVYVFGLPYLTNRISINSEQDIVNVRLLSICPPDALRPYFQEGYVAGTDEVTTEYASKDELDFNGRLIAKFRIQDVATFWSGDFLPIPKEALYPEDDRIKNLCAEISQEVSGAVRPSELGMFLQAWSGLESRLLSMARRGQGRVYSLTEAIRALRETEQISPQLASQLDDLRRTRNKAVHQVDKLKPGEMLEATEKIEDLSKQLKSPRGEKIL